MPTHPSSNDGPPTRTRLPETPGGTGAGTARRPRSGRNLVTVVGVIVLLIAALAFANRGDSTPGAPGPDDGAQAGSTAPTGERPVEGRNAGIAAGFPQTDQGAQSAAANYAVALGGDGMFRAERRREILTAIHTPETAASLEQELDKAYSPAFLQNVGLDEDGLAPDGFTFVSRTIPVGTKVTEYGGDDATVEVWCTGLVGLAGEGSTKPVTQNWFTLTQQLQWTDGDWKISSSSQEEGPAPIGGDDRVAGAQEIAEAVQGYGGFTYAR